jgi:trimeric autotransporter adhesin
MACGDDAEKPAPVISSISITPTAPSLAAGTTQQLSATALFTDMTTVNVTSMVTWSSSAAGTAAVNASGLLSGVAVGNATIRAQLGGVSGTTNATITAALLRSIAVTPPNRSLALGTSQQLTATGTFSDNTTQDLTAQVTWATSAAGNVTVSPGGEVTAVTVGGATITATRNGISGSTMVSATAAVLVSIAITPAAPSLARGRTLQLTATGTFSDATTQNLTSQVTWESDTPAAATIDAAGLVTSVDPGTTTITATLDAISGTLLLTTTDAEVVSIAVTPITASVAAGRTQQFTATGTFTDTTTQDITDQVTWTSSDETVAQVSNADGSRGLATTLKKGTAAVTATLGVISGSAILEVTDAELDSIAVTPITPSIALGLTQQFTATGTFSDQTTQDLTTQVTWASSAEAIALISNADGTRGLATTVAVGTTTIKATLGDISGETVFTVNAAALVSIAVTPPTPSLALGLTQQFTATGTFTDLTVQDLTDQVTWASSVEAVATISNADNSRGLASTASVGTTVISATFPATTGPDIVGSTTLTVTAAELLAIQVTPVNPSIADGTTLQFTATGVFTNGTQNLTTQVTWASSDPAVAAISNDGETKGLATALEPGTTTISATFDGKEGTSVLTVTDAEVVSIQVEPINQSLPIGLTQQFTATGTFSDQTTQDLTGQVTWASSVIAVAEISNAAETKGRAEAIALGSTEISATFGDVTGVATLTVTPAVLQVVLVTDQIATVAKGRTKQFLAQGLFSDGTTQNLTDQATWQSSNEQVATVSNADGSRGLASSVEVGVTTISATFDGRTGTATLEVTVAVLDTISVTPLDPSIVEGTTQQFAAIGTFSDQTTQDLTTGAAWVSGDPAVAQVSNVEPTQGLATAVAPGTTTISATVTALDVTVTGSTTLTVTAAELVSIAVAPVNSTIVEGHTRQFIATGTFNNNTTQDLTNLVTWLSVDEAVAVISNADGTRGLATALTAGAVAIAATRLNVTGMAGLTVVAAPNHLVINEIDYDQIAGDTAEYVEIYNPTNAPISLANKTLVLVNGANVANRNYEIVDLGLAPVASLGPRQYLVIAGAAVVVPPSAVKLETDWVQDAIQNGLADGAALIDATTQTLIDALSYEGAMNPIILPGFPAAVSLVEGTVLPTNVADSNDVIRSLCRGPDGIDLDNAATDWTTCTTLTPGTANP